MPAHPTEEQQEWMLKIAKHCASQHSVSTEDTYQHLWVKWLEAGSTFAGYLDGSERGKAHVLVALTRWATAYARAEQEARAVGQKDRYHYTRDELRALLPFVESPEHWSTLASPAPDDGMFTKQDPALLGTAMAVWADLQHAWGELTPHQRWLLRARFVSPEPVPYSELAEESGVAEATLRKDVERAVGRMQRALGGARRRRVEAQPVAGRHAVSNAAAQSYARRVWDG